MNEVSPSCGCRYEDSWISDCCAAEIHKNAEIITEPGSYSDVCSTCKKDADTTGYICNECGNWFEYTEDKDEQKARIKENYYEEMADAKRKYGE